MKITSEQISETLVIHAEGRLDATNTASFEKEMLPLVQQPQHNVLINFDKIEYISSAGLRSVLILAKEFKTHHKNMALCCLKQSLQEVFKITGFDTIITIYCTTEEGLAAIKG